MCSFLIGFFGVLILSGAVFYECLRWISIQEECKERRDNHNKLVTSELCKKGYGENVEAICSKASVELRTPIYVWTSMEWWKRGEIHHLYSKLTESYISLLALILFPILYIIYKIFDSLKQKDIDDRVERMISKQTPLMIPYEYPPQEFSERRRRNNNSSHFISGPKDF